MQGVQGMKLKTLMGLGIVGLFAYKGYTLLKQADNNEISDDDFITNLAKDGIDAGKDVIKIFSENEQEKNMIDVTAELSKTAVDVVGKI